MTLTMTMMKVMMVMMLMMTTNDGSFGKTTACVVHVFNKTAAACESSLFFVMFRLSDSVWQWGGKLKKMSHAARH